ncbi:hypothetical protein V6N13_007898 [Hibiscus sabdariffa]
MGWSPSFTKGSPTLASYVSVDKLLKQTSAGPKSSMPTTLKGMMLQTYEARGYPPIQQQSTPSLICQTTYRASMSSSEPLKMWIMTSSRTIYACQAPHGT